MGTRKTVIIISSVLVALTLLVGIFVGGVTLFYRYSLGTSDAAITAKEFLRKNDQLRQDIGEVKDFGTFVSNLSVGDGSGTATLGLEVIGERRTVKATVELFFRNGYPWRVVSASYKNEAGATVDLLNPYDSFLLVPTLVS